MSLVAKRGKEQLALEYSGARIVAPTYSADRLQQAWKHQRRRLIPMLIWSAAMLIGSIPFMVIQLREQNIGWLLFGFALLAGVSWLGWRHLRQALQRDYGAILAPHQVQGQPAGTLVTVTGTVKHGDQSGQWGHPDCVWIAFPSSSTDQRSNDGISIHQSGGYVWLGDEGDGPQVIADFSHATTGQIGYPTDVEPEACAWALCVGDRISVTGILSWAPGGVAVIGAEHRDLFSGGEVESSVEVSHPVTDHQPSLSAAEPGQPALAWGGRVGPQVVVLPPGMKLHWNIGLRIG